MITMITVNSSPSPIGGDDGFDEALHFLQRRAFPQAATLFERYVNRHPRSQPAWANLSLAYRGLGEVYLQLGSAQRASELDPDSPGSLLVLAEAYLASGQFAAALDRARIAWKRFPEENWPMEVSAKAERQLGRPEKAIEWAKKGIKRTPFFNLVMHQVYADSLRMLGKYDAAIKRYDLILENREPVPPMIGGDPWLHAMSGKAISLLLKAQVTADIQTWRAMLTITERVLDRVRGDPVTLVAAGIGRRHMGELDLSLQCFDRAEVIGGPDSFLALHRGMTLNELGRFEGSRRDFEFAVANATDDHVRQEALTWRPLPIVSLGKLDEAMIACEEALTQGVDNAVLRNSRALIYLAREDMPSAERELLEAQRLDGDDPVVLSNLGWIALQRDDFPRADLLLDRAIEINERGGWGGWRVWVAKYLSLGMQGRNDEMQQLFGRAEAALSDYPEVLQRVFDAIDRVALERNLALAASRLEEVEASGSIASIGLDIGELRNRIQALRRLLEKQGVTEEEIKQFLKSHASRLIFGLDCWQIHTEHELGSDFQADFVLEYAPKRYMVVEIENPNRSLYTQRGRPTAALTHAKQQVEDWQQWIEENNPYAQKKLPGCVSPEGLVVIGRSSTLKSEDLMRLERSNINTRGKVRVITYDELLNAATWVLDNLEASKHQVQ
jgi:tetratricopeptide (TPR) repeat protein